MTSASSNFDCSDIYREHAFLVRLTKGRDAKAQVFEVFGHSPAGSEAVLAPETVLRCEISRDTWDAVSAEVRVEFNRRLKMDNKLVGRWGAEETAVQRLLGKELLVLLWAVEQAAVSAEEVAVAIRNWLGLKPEERWWLYTMTAASTGLAHQAGMGWRDALCRALCFGTRRDTFHLGSVVGRGSLEPRPNLDYASRDQPAPLRRPRKKKAAASDSPSLIFVPPPPAE